MIMILSAYRQFYVTQYNIILSLMHPNIRVSDEENNKQQNKQKKSFRNQESVVHLRCSCCRFVDNKNETMSESKPESFHHMLGRHTINLLMIHLCWSQMFFSPSFQIFNSLIKKDQNKCRCHFTLAHPAVFNILYEYMKITYRCVYECICQQLSGCWCINR